MELHGGQIGVEDGAVGARFWCTLPLGVVVRIDEPGLPMSELPGGATGTGAIYTNSMKPTHVIRKVMIRMQSFINYLVP